MNDDLINPDQTIQLKNLLSYIAAFLGIGTFLGFVNLLVGLLSGGWLCIQIYGYLVHELPMKRMNKKLKQLEYCKALETEKSHKVAICERH